MPPPATGAAEADREERLADLLVQITEQHQRGQRPDVERLARDHPDLAGELRQLANIALIADSVARATPDETLAYPPVADPVSGLPRPFADFDLRAEVTPGQAVRAVFPGGTITGCPKVRCMQIIAELEGVGRGAYTGAMGWLNRDGDLDLNILIRSAEVEGDTLRFRTGAGIVADSDPQKELDETRAKARGMLRALGVAG